MKNFFKALFGKKEVVKESSKNTGATTAKKQQPTQIPVENPQEKREYSLSVKVASVMGNSIYAEFNGYNDEIKEKRIKDNFLQTEYLESDEIPLQFKMCNVFFHKKVDIHEAAAIMYAEQKAEPSANTRIDDSGMPVFYPTDVKNCQTQGKISWPGGSIKITRILMPSVEEGMYHLVVINS